MIVHFQPSIHLRRPRCGGLRRRPFPKWVPGGSRAHNGRFQVGPRLLQRERDVFRSVPAVQDVRGDGHCAKEDDRAEAADEGGEVGVGGSARDRTI